MLRRNRRGVVLRAPAQRCYPWYDTLRGVVPCLDAMLEVTLPFKETPTTDVVISTTQGREVSTKLSSTQSWSDKRLLLPSTLTALLQGLNP